ncbi:MAG: phospho-sugar mutase [Firmicutes bacterium]|nr:phospho-sugar mutase [Bacillota bacterium]
MNAPQRYQAWLRDPLIDQRTKAELSKLADNQEEIEDRFFRWLEFGTGGLRGTVGAGSNRMNIYTVRLVTQALANFLKSKGIANRGAAISYDSRNMSSEFAREAANVLVGNGIPVFVFAEMAPTPLLSFAVRHCQAAAGIIITASHNPPEYNGYKAYNQHGNQFLPDDALAISSQMSELSLADVLLDPRGEKSGLWRWWGQEVCQAYIKSLLEIAPSGSEVENLRVLYTPLHGTGARFVPEVLKRAGFKKIETVAEQMIPDGNFPTVRFPNPQETASFRLGFQYAAKQPFDLIIATDPDADRMGAAVNQKGDWVLLDGNHIGILLLDFILSRLPAGELQEAVVIKTIVTTEMTEPIAEKYGVEVYNTLTGFKYIGALMDQLAAEGKHFLFGFEESYGYLAGTAIRDKDAVLASLLIAQAAAFYQKKGLSLQDRLEELMQEHGYYLQDQVAYSFSTSREAERSQEFIRQLQQAPIEKIGAEKVLKVLDYDRSKSLDLRTAKESVLDFPQERALQWITEKNSKITLRPSGTEPKMKLYLEVADSAQNRALQRLEDLKNAFSQIVKKGIG